MDKGGAISRSGWLVASSFILPVHKLSQIFQHFEFHSGKVSISTHGTPDHSLNPSPITHNVWIPYPDMCYRASLHNKVLSPAEEIGICPDFSSFLSSQRIFQTHSTSNDWSTCSQCSIIQFIH